MGPGLFHGAMETPRANLAAPVQSKRRIGGSPTAHCPGALTHRWYRDPPLKARWEGGEES